MWFIVGVDWEVFTAAKAISATRRMIEARFTYYLLIHSHLSVLSNGSLI
jgi:hypothetical protein